MRTAWTTGEITFDEAVFLARRVVFDVRYASHLPVRVRRAALWFYDLFFEPVKVDNHTVDISPDRP